MWYTVLITTILDIGGLLLIYALLRDRVRRAASSDAHVAEIRDEVSRLLVELNRTTDRNIALIEDRIASLNELLSGADKKIGLLRREIEKHDVGTQIYDRLAEGRSRVSGTQAQATRSRREMEKTSLPSPERLEAPPEVAADEAEAMTAAAAAGTRARQAAHGGPPLAVELSDRPENRIGHSGPKAPEWREDEPEPLQEQGQMPQPRQERERATGKVAAGAAAGKPPDLQQRVLMLHNAGFAASLIASRVGVPLGEVELIIALQERKGRA